MILNSRTSGVDGSSEGGRINTDNLVNTLALFGTALMDEFRSRGYQGKFRVEPGIRKGIWVLVATSAEEPPDHLPKLWHGRQVVVEREAAPPGA